MAMLHYGGTRTFEVSDADVPELIGAIAAELADGQSGWVAFTDEPGQDWSILVSPGVPIFIDAKADGAQPGAGR